MRYPKFLSSHGTIGFVAPSFGCAIEPYYSAFQNALNKFHSLGYQTKLGDNCYSNVGIGISNTKEKCGEELNHFFLEDDSDVLIACGGGELMCEVVPYIDFDRLKKAEPKWYMGFSDNTNLTFLLATICDTASICGPNASSFGMEPWHSSIKDSMDLLTGKKLTVHGYDLWEKESLKDELHPFEPYHVTEPVQLVSYPEVNAKMEGRLIGGTLDCLCTIAGTRFDHVKEFIKRYQEDGIIWFLESCELNVMSIRRAMWQMEHAGWFKYVKAFVIGRPLCFGEEAFGMDQYNAVCGAIEQHHVPVYMDVDLGHLAPMLPIVCGSMAEVSFDDGKFELHMEFV